VNDCRSLKGDETEEKGTERKKEKSEDNVLRRRWLEELESTLVSRVQRKKEGF